ncbi:MAG: RluA family pseudouridine synthase [Clostridiaceae bacterium]|nr:RluA family pseudouridine synthase [Clostridia bacterium]MDY3869675.1 RluA family pseudouridine synthase [Clostridiaceae bacterium]
METIFLAAGAEDRGRRLDQFLADGVEDLTRSAAQRLAEEQRVLLDGRPLKKNYKITGSETLEVSLPDPEPIDAAPQDIPLDIVYEDGDVLVINKPKGMVVHPAPGNPDGTVVNAVLYHCGSSLSGIGGAFRPGIVHRIDKDTSGLLIVAKNDRAHLCLSAQLKDHTLARTYEAVVIGTLKEDRGTVDAPLDRSPKDRKKMAVVPGGRRAVTHYEVLARYPGYTHVRCRLETGRTHQIRVHMASLGHPIAGDTVYGPAKQKYDLQGQCLHARELTFLHPADGRKMHLKCELPGYFTDFLNKLGRST